MNGSAVGARLLYRFPEAAQLLGLGRSTVYELVQRGELPVVRVGRAVRIAAEDLQAWVAAHREDW